MTTTQYFQDKLNPGGMILESIGIITTTSHISLIGDQTFTNLDV